MCYGLFIPSLVYIFIIRKKIIQRQNESVIVNITKLENNVIHFCVFMKYSFFFVTFLVFRIQIVHAAGAVEYADHTSAKR